MKNKAIIVIHPVIAPLISCINWSRMGYKVIALIADVELISDYLKKTLAESHFDETLLSTGNIEEDIKLLKEKQKDYHFEFGYIGSEALILYGEKILHEFFPDKSNDPKTSIWRYNKFSMNERLKEISLPYIQQCRIAHHHITPIAEKFLEEVPYPVVVKPSFNSAGSDNVYFCDNLMEAMERIRSIGEIGYFGQDIPEVIVQEKISGTEFIVDSFSFEGEHRFSTVMQYEKYNIKNMPIYRTLTAISAEDPLYLYLTECVKKIITALDVRFGFSHTEIMLTPENQVKLIELNLRPSGLGGLINDLAYEHYKVNQYTIGQDFLTKSKTVFHFDHEKFCIYILNNLGFTYQKIDVDLLNTLESCRSIKILKPSCEKIPEKNLLADSVAFIHLANASQTKLDEDIQLLKFYEQEGTLFL